MIDDGVPVARAVAFVDDTGYDKIAHNQDTGYVFAGPGEVIDKWRNWVLAVNQAVLPRPQVATDFAICMTDLESGEIIFEHGQKVRDTLCRMAGTGAKAAYECWSVNSDAKKAVATASLADVFSGGEVKYLNGLSKSHNLNFLTPFSSIKDEFLKKGMVMYLGTHDKPIPLTQAAQNDPRIKELVDNVRSGKASAEAPSGLDPVIWTPADIKRLDDALALRRKKHQSP